MRSGPLRRAALLAALTVGALAAAQPRAEVRLGVAGNAVTGAWNPLVWEVRDLPGAELTLDLDVGSLQGGAVRQRLRLVAPNSGGVQRREVDVPLQGWRSLAWRVVHGERLVASGTLDPRQRDERPLDVLVSSQPGHWRDQYPADARTVGAAASELPRRAAAFDGVRSILVDGSAAAPSAQSLLAAAVAGAEVRVVTPVPRGHAGLEPLLEEGGLRVGAGSVRPVGEGSLPPVASGSEEGPSLPRAALAAFEASLAPPPWSHRPAGTVALVALAYAGVVLLMVRVGGVPGLLSALLVAGAAAALAVPWLRPADPEPSVEHHLWIAADGLARRVALLDVARLPAGTTEVRGLLRPWSSRPVQWRDGTTHVPLVAGERQRLLGPPQAVDAPLAWRDGALADRSGLGWDASWVVGLGAQGALEADGEVVARRTSRAAPEAWRDFLEALPEGTAVAWRDDDVAVLRREDGAP